MDQQLYIEVRNGADPVEVSLIGDIDMATEAQVIGALSPFADNEVIVDLSRVGFIDSSGIRALIVGHRAAAAAGGSLALRSPSAQTARVLEMTRIGTVITIIE